MIKRLLIAAVLIGGSAFAWIKYSHRHTAVEVPVAPVRQGDFSVLINCRGSLTARRSVQLIAPVGVQDLQIVWLAPSGSRVKEGEPVIRFDQSRLRQELQEKNTALRQAQAALDQAEAQSRMRIEQDKVDMASARYQMERARLEASKQAIVSASEGQKSAIDLDLAKEKVTLQTSAAELHQKSDDSKSASLRRQRDEARAEVERIQHLLAVTAMKSPLNGVVTYLTNMSQGWMNAQPFKQGDHVAAGAPIAEIPDLSTLEMESKVEETDRGHINTGDTVRVHVDAFPEKIFDAKLASISPLTEQSFEEWPPTRTFRAFAQLNSPDERLRPSMNANADIIEATLKNVSSVPAKALFTHNGQAVVYVKTAGQYLRTPVKVRARNTDEIAVDGVTGGAQVALVDPEAPVK